MVSLVGSMPCSAVFDHIANELPACIVTYMWSVLMLHAFDFVKVLLYTYVALEDRLTYSTDVLGEPVVGAELCP